MAGKDNAGYPIDVSDEEWAFVLPYLLLSRENSAHRDMICDRFSMAFATG